MKILVATDKPFAKLAVDEIRKQVENANLELRLLENYSDKAQLIDAVKEVDALIVRSDLIDKNVIEASDKLKIIVRAGAGYDNIDIEAATKQNIVVMNTPGQNSNAVAELVLGLMIFSARNFFNGKSGTELKNKKIGIHAYGNVGKLVAKLAKGFGMEVYAYDPFISKEIIENDEIEYIAEMEQLYSTCDYVSVNIPLTETTKKMIDYSLLQNLTQGAVIINTARKEIINETDLIKLMEERNDIKYLSDLIPDNVSVFKENFSGRFFFTPKKMGAQTEEANINAGIAAASQIIDFFKTGNTNFKVN